MGVVDVFKLQKWYQIAQTSHIQLKFHENGSSFPAINEVEISKLKMKIF